jgi:hypothetical protein
MVLLEHKLVPFCKNEYYLIMLFEDKISKKQDKELRNIIEESIPIGRGDPKHGLSYIDGAKDGDYAVTFDNSGSAIEMYKKLIDKKYIKELRMGRIEYNYT